MLRVYNVEDAYDIEYSKISNIKGFGPTMRTTLLVWRLSLEQKFQFEPNQSIDPRDIRVMEQEINQKRADAIQVLTSGPQVLQQSLNYWSVLQGSVKEQLNRSAKRLAQAAVDMNALRRW